MVVEASLCKVPTVAFEVEGIKEAIPANFHEFIVKQNDIESLVGKIHDLLNSEKYIPNMPARRIKMLFQTGISGP